MKTTTALKPIMISWIAFSFVFSQSGYAAEPKITAEIQTTSPEETLSRDELQAVSLAGGLILKHVNRARTAIAMNKPEDAKTQVDQALKLVEIIRTAAPVHTITSRISAGDLQYESEEKVQPVYVPLFDDISRVSILSPVMAAKGAASNQMETAQNRTRQGQARQQEARSQGETGAGASQPSVPAAPVVSDVELRFTRVLFDIQIAEAHLLQAKKALAENNLLFADAALIAVLQGVIVEQGGIEMPLAKAAQNLTLANAMISQGDLVKAKTAMQETTDALRMYVRLAGEERSQEASALLGEMSEFTKSLGNKQQVPKEAPEKISRWQQQISGWFAAI